MIPLVLYLEYYKSVKVVVMKFNSMQLKPSSFESNVELTEGEIEDWKGRVRMSMNIDPRSGNAVSVPGEIEASIVKSSATKLIYIESDDWFQLAFIKSEFDAIIEEFKEPFEKYMKYGITDGKLVIEKDRNAIITLVGDINGIEVKFGGGNFKTIDELITMLKILATVNVDAQYISKLSEQERDDLYFSNKETVLVLRNLRILSYVFMH